MTRVKTPLWWSCSPMSVLKDINSLIKVLQVPLDRTQTVPQLVSCPVQLLFGGSSTPLQQLAPSVVEALCCIYCLLYLTAKNKQKSVAFYVSVPLWTININIWHVWLKWECYITSQYYNHNNQCEFKPARILTGFVLYHARLQRFVRTKWRCWTEISRPQKWLWKYGNNDSAVL